MAVQATFSLTLAAATSFLDDIKHVPKETWINIAICVLAVVVVVRLWGALKKFNDFAPYMVALAAGAVIFFYWVYERQEPRFLSPMVDKIAPFFPSNVDPRKVQEKNRPGRGP